MDLLVSRDVRDLPAAGALLPSVGELRVLIGPDSAPPRDDVGVGPALLREVAAVGTGGWLRLYRPAPAVAFSRRDTLSPGFDAAVAASASRGFTPTLRAPGGRAVVFHEDTLCIDLVVADPEPRWAATRRFVEFAALLVEALETVGVRAQVGPVPDEYCPGSHSVNAGGRLKLAGTAQRVVRGGWFLGAALLVDRADAVRDVVGPVYDALGMACDVRTVGAVTDVAAGVTVDDVSAAVIAAVNRRASLRPDEGPPDLLERARGSAPDHPRLPLTAAGSPSILAYRCKI